MKKIHWIISILVFIIICGTLSFADIKNPGVPPINEIWLGIKTFTNGIRIGADPNNAFLSNGNLTAKTIYSNGNITATLDANSHVADALIYDKHTNLDANSIGLGVAVDPNYIIKSNIMFLRTNGHLSLGAETANAGNYSNAISCAFIFPSYISCNTFGGNPTFQGSVSVSGNLSMAAGRTITIDGIVHLEKAVSLSADPNNVMTDPSTYYTLPTGVAGKLYIWNNTGEARYHVSSTGVITLDKQDSGFNDSYVKGYICVEDAGTGGRVHNCTEAVDKVGIKFEYFTP